MGRPLLAGLAAGAAAALLARDAAASWPWGFPVPWGGALFLGGAAAAALPRAPGRPLLAALLPAAAVFLLPLLPAQGLMLAVLGWVAGRPALGLPPGALLLGTAAGAVLPFPWPPAAAALFLLAGLLARPGESPPAPPRLLAFAAGGVALALLAFGAAWSAPALGFAPVHALAVVIGATGLGLLPRFRRVPAAADALLLLGAAVGTLLALRGLLTAALAEEARRQPLFLAALAAPGLAGGAALPPGGPVWTLRALLAGGALGAFLAPSLLPALGPALAWVGAGAFALAACAGVTSWRGRTAVAATAALLLAALGAAPRPPLPAGAGPCRPVLHPAGFFRRERLPGAVGGQVLRLPGGAVFGPRSRASRRELLRTLRFALALSDRPAVVGLYDPPHPDLLRPALADPGREETVVRFSAALLRAGWETACRRRAAAQGRPLTLGRPDRPLDLLCQWAHPALPAAAAAAAWRRSTADLRAHGIYVLWVPLDAPPRMLADVLAAWLGVFPRSTRLFLPEVDARRWLGLVARAGDRSWSPPLPRRPEEAALYLGGPTAAAALARVLRRGAPAATALRGLPRPRVSPLLKKAAALGARLRAAAGSGPADPAALLPVALDALAEGAAHPFVRRFVGRVGFALLARDRTAEAALLFRRARERAPDWAGAAVGLAAVERARHPRTRAAWARVQALLEEALGRDPRQPRAWLLLGICQYEGLQDDAAARRCFERAAALDPYDPQIKAHLWRYLDRDGRVEEAAALLLDAVEAFPEDRRLPRALLALVPKLRLAGRLGQALYVLERLAPALARDAGYHLARSEILWDLGRRGEAVAAARKACRLQEPPAEGYFLHLYRLLRATDRRREAAELRGFMRHVFRRDPERVLGG